MKTNQELAEILANETMNISDMHFQTNNNKPLDKQCWAWLHMGFIIGMKLADSGKTQKDFDEILDICQSIISKKQK